MREYFKKIILPCSIINDIYYDFWTKDFLTIEELENRFSDRVSPFMLHKVLLEKYQIDCFLKSGLLEEFGFEKSSDFFMKFNKKLYKLFNKYKWKNDTITCEDF